MTWIPGTRPRMTSPSSISDFPNLLLTNSGHIATAAACRFRGTKQDLGPFSGVDEGLCRLKGDHNVRRPPRREGVPFCSPPVFPLHGGERACRDRWGKRSVK